VTRPQTEHHKRERPGGEIERAVEDLYQLTSTVLAVGVDEARRTVDATPAATAKRILLDEAVRRARVLMAEAGGDR
jgi:hypothetical protein